MFVFEIDRRIIFAWNIRHPGVDILSDEAEEITRQPEARRPPENGNPIFERSKEVG